MPEQIIKAFIVDDHALIIEGLKSALKNYKDIEVVGYALNAKSCLDFFNQHQQVDVLLLDINLPDMDGIDLCEELLKLQPDLKIIGLSTLTEKSYISKLLENGAKGFIIKNTAVNEICEAIRHVYNGHMFISKEAGDNLYNKTNHTASTNQIPTLTRREKEILKYLADGLTAVEIAEKLFLSQLTIESHRRNIMAKFKAKNAAMLIKIAMENNLL